MKHGSLLALHSLNSVHNRPRTSRIVDSQPTHLPEAKSEIYDDCVDILEPIITSDDRKITKSRDMLITPELSLGHTWKVPCTTSNAHQKDAKQNNIMGPTLPSSNSPLDSTCPVKGTQAKQVPQLTSAIPNKRKIKGHSDLNSILT